ncbi:hypothetical protein M3Y97_00170800 [Aphelenchoides bicaudatus]|nr:hypothetical protein M3Y97_00170800 [Aphelenchoides bicaudatus]
MTRFIAPTSDKISGTLCSSIRKHSKRTIFGPSTNLNIAYYIDEQKRNLLEKMDIQLPDDYYWVTLSERDAEQICAEQIYTSKADEKFVALRIRNFPSVGVAYKPLGELAEAPGNLACYEYTDGLGVISLLYCQKAHRGKRLATLVEQKICQRNIIEQGIIPYKGVSINRPRVVQMTAKSGIWTACLDEDQNEELHFCSLYSRKDQPRVFIYED